MLKIWIHDDALAQQMYVSIAKKKKRKISKGSKVRVLPFDEAIFLSERAQKDMVIKIR